MALWPFFKKGYFETHDGEWMVIRFSAFHQTLKDGQIPVRFVERLNHGFGYPIMNFLYPLPFYMAEFPQFLQLGYTASIKSIFVFSTIVSAIGMFWALSQLFPKFSSFVGAIVYLYSPYRFLDLYVRGSLGESVAFAVVPLIFGAIFKVIKGELIFLPALSILSFSLITAHNIMAAIFLPIIIIYVLAYTKKFKFKILTALIVGVFLASFFWIPAIYDLQYVRLSVIKVSNPLEHLVSFKDLIIPRWGFGVNPHGQDSFSPQIGLVNIFVLITTLFVMIRLRLKNNFVNLMAVVTMAAIFIMSEYSKILWETFSILAIIQYPWRLLSIIVFSSAVFSCFILNSFKKPILVGLFIVLFSIGTTFAYTKPKNFVNRGDDFYGSNGDSTAVKDEYMPLWVFEKPPRPPQKIEIPATVSINKLNLKNTSYKATFDVKETSKIQVNTVYFPGWKVVSGDKKLPIDYSNHSGIITFTLPAGLHEVIIKYGKTPVHLISEIISLISFIGLSSYFLYLWRKQNS